MMRMKKPQSLLFTEHKLVIWLITIVFMISASVFIYFIIIYFSSQQDKTSTFADSIESAKQETGINHIETVRRYNGQFPYDVIAGNDEQGEEVFVFVPVHGDQPIQVVGQSEGYSREEILSVWRSQCNQCTLIQMTPGYEDGRAIWELIYTDVNDQYVFEYYYFHSGKLYEQFILKKPQS